jgi:hypothetical protein
MKGNGRIAFIHCAIREPNVGVITICGLEFSEVLLHWFDGQAVPSESRDVTVYRVKPLAIIGSNLEKEKTGTVVFLDKQIKGVKIIPARNLVTGMFKHGAQYLFDHKQ